MAATEGARRRGGGPAEGLHSVAPVRRHAGPDDLRHQGRQAAPLGLPVAAEFRRVHGADGQAEPASYAGAPRCRSRAPARPIAAAPPRPARRSRVPSRTRCGCLGPPRSARRAGTRVPSRPAPPACARHRRGSGPWRCRWRRGRRRSPPRTAVSRLAGEPGSVRGVAGIDTHRPVSKARRRVLGGTGVTSDPGLVGRLR